MMNEKREELMSLFYDKIADKCKGCGKVHPWESLSEKLKNDFLKGFLHGTYLGIAGVKLKDISPTQAES